MFDADSARRLPKEVARSWISAIAALRPSLLRDAQAKLVGHQSDDVARLSAFLTGLRSGTVDRLGSYKTQKPRWPLPGKYYDARSWLLFDIASSTPNVAFKSQLKLDLEKFGTLSRTIPENRILARVTKRLR